jgi:hypothetical protein
MLSKHLSRQVKNDYSAIVSFTTRASEADEDECKGSKLAKKRRGDLPSKACWTLLFKVCLLCDAEEGAPDDGGFEVRLISRWLLSESQGGQVHGAHDCVSPSPFLGQPTPDDCGYGNLRYE